MGPKGGCGPVGGAPLGHFLPAWLPGQVAAACSAPPPPPQGPGMQVFKTDVTRYTNNSQLDMQKILFNTQLLAIINVTCKPE